MFFILFIVSCKEFKEAQVTGVKGFQMKKMNTEGIEAVIQLEIKNPNNIGFSIYPSAFDVEFSGIKLGQAKLSKRVHIGPNCEKTYDFQLKSSFKDLSIMDLTGLLSSNKLGFISVKGDLKAGKFYFKKRFPVNVKEKINLKN